MANAIHCSECGIATDAKCSCDKSYVRMSAIDAAKLAIAKYPDWSNVRIAEEVGCSVETVRKARFQDTNNLHSETRVIGSDGKSYPAKQKRQPREVPHTPKTPPVSREEFEETIARGKVIGLKVAHDAHNRAASSDPISCLIFDLLRIDLSKRSQEDLNRLREACTKAISRIDNQSPRENIKWLNTRNG